MSALAPVRQLANAQRLYDAMEPEESTSDQVCDLHTVIAAGLSDFPRLYHGFKGTDRPTLERLQRVADQIAEDAHALSDHLQYLINGKD